MEKDIRFPISHEDSNLLNEIKLKISKLTKIPIGRISNKVVFAWALNQYHSDFVKNGKGEIPSEFTVSEVS